MEMYLRFRIVGEYSVLRVRNLCGRCFNAYARPQIKADFLQTPVYKGPDGFFHVLVPEIDSLKRYTMQCPYCGRYSLWCSGELEIDPFYSVDMPISKIFQGSFEDKLFKLCKRLEKCTE